VDNKELIEVLEERRGEHHLIILPNYPDTDAIAAAFAHRLLSAEYDIKVTIIYSGNIRPRQNVALIRLLGIDILPFRDDLEFSKFSAALMVRKGESVAPEIRRAIEQARLPIFLNLDQMNSLEQKDGEVSNSQKSDTISTHYAALIQKGLINLDRSRKDHGAVATALLFGIHSSTENFVAANEADLIAASFLSRFRDAELLEYVMSQVRSKYVMEIIRRALGNRITAENYSIAGIGYLRAEDREAISQAAEFLLTEENVHTAIVYGILQYDNLDEILVGAVCTSKLTLYPLEFIEELFGKYIREDQKEANLIAEDSFNIPIGFLSGNHTEPFKDLKWQVYDTKMKHILFEKIGIKMDAVIETS
jgi:nanoRNase/pAp phosphatase (c-di-AMP/oligoRNAs hydrolase)